jgi:hypothetical protein
MEQQEQQEQQAQQAQQPIGLTLQDLKVLAGAIELGAQRGGYRAPEMEIIGATYNKLAAFLKANEPAQPAEETAEAPAEAPAEEVTAEQA